MALDIPAHIDAAAVAAIVAIDDPVVRNLWITQAYSDFSRRLLDVVHRPSTPGAAPVTTTNLTWCGFAVWASATAGRTIREEDLSDVVAEILERGDHGHHHAVAEINLDLAALRPPPADSSGISVQQFAGLPPVGTTTLAAALQNPLTVASRHVANGNRVVFAELAPLFVAFLEQFEHSPAVDAAQLGAALEAANGAPLPDDLRAAFGWYAHAAGSSAADERAGAVLAGNVLAVAHEQRRLQDDIAAAMDAGLVLADEIVDTLLRHLRLGHLVDRAHRIRHALDALVQSLWQTTITRMLMTLRVPGAELRLAEPLPPLADGALFPHDLLVLTGPPGVDPGVAAVLAAWDRTGGTGHHDGAADWAELDQRMNYIVNLFRSRQQRVELDTAPFTAEQLATMRQGTVPGPPLLPARHG